MGKKKGGKKKAQAFTPLESYLASTSSASTGQQEAAASHQQQASGSDTLQQPQPQQEQKEQQSKVKQQTVQQPVQSQQSHKEQLPPKQTDPKSQQHSQPQFDPRGQQQPPRQMGPPRQKLPVPQQSMQSQPQFDPRGQQQPPRQMGPPRQELPVPQQSIPRQELPAQQSLVSKKPQSEQKQKVAAEQAKIKQQSKQRMDSGSSQSSLEKSAEPKVTSGQSYGIASPAKVSVPANLVDMYLQSIPKRKNFKSGGTLGRRITVETNMFSLIFNQNFRTDAVHYDVTITPDKPKFLMRTVFETFRAKTMPKRYPAYDGKKNAYSASNLPFGDYVEGNVEVFDAERQQNRTFNIKLNKVATIDLSWLKTVGPGFNETSRDLTSIQVLDIILRNGPAFHNVTVGRSLFPHQDNGVVSLSNGMALWVGAFQSAVLGWKPYLNIDVAHKAFPKCQSVIDLMIELCENPRDRRYGGGDSRPANLNLELVERNSEKIAKYLKGLKVQYMIPNIPTSKRTHRVNGLVECAATHKFAGSDGKTFTIEQYFAQEKQYKIKYPRLKCLWVGPMDKKVYIPAELCTIVAGQAVQRKLDENQTSTMIKYAATNTETRKEKIMKAFAALRLNDNPSMKDEFRLSVQGQMEKVPARVLNPPKLLYDKEVRVSKGVWRAGKFLNARGLEDNTWTILNLNNRVREQDLYTLSGNLQEGGKAVGMFIGKPQTPFKTLPPPTRDIRQIQQYFQSKKDEDLKLVVVIIPDYADGYSKVKQITELNVGVLTQCLKSQTLRKLNPATIGNILLKINSKLNGINHAIHSTEIPMCLSKPCILIGADVTHPSPDAIGIPSIAAVAASHDPHAFLYNIEIRLQPPKTEIIQDLCEIMYQQLLYFYKATNRKPLKVIFYRDGVSEGQLVQVIHHEISAIKKAFRKLSPSGEYNPPITFLVVQKRHHIRLFPTDGRNSDDRNFNVQAGTIVDTHITHPSHIDFYLVSHASIQGTARPTKYRCICNESDLSEDEIEQLTYYLCHMFARCTRSVSYPAPTYYAHLAAFRARALIHQVPIRLDKLQEEQNKLKLKVDMNKSPMFFV
ncbi:hypothetical protein KM043_017975 [Ampulex compressa]|nr:hypothetical protein KM043_017975 [Ampulex compressa]